MVCTLGVAGCGAGGLSSDIPGQNYVNSLVAMTLETGDIAGRVLFPSEYDQRSALFGLDHLTFVTYPDGRFRIRRVPVGVHRLTLSVKGFEPVEAAVTVEKGRVVQVAPLRLVKARGRVLGRLVDDKGRSAAGLQLVLGPLGTATRSDTDGIFQFIGVTTGEHILVVNDPVFFSGNKRFQLESNERRNLGIIRVYRQTTLQPSTVGLRN
jgi:hypothetical protein